MNQKNKDQDMPNRQSNMEKAEGSRESVLDSTDRFEHGSRESELTRGKSPSERERSRSERSKGAGITNRGIDREEEEQSHLPDRGDSGSER